MNNQPKYKRQRFLLAFIRQLKDSVTSTDLQKLVFLCMMEEGLDFYEFIPYKFGSYSFQLAEDLNVLWKAGYISIESNSESTRIKAVGGYPQEGYPKETSFQITTERGSSLIRKAYKEYPYYAINSEIIGRFFSRKETERFKNEKQKYVKSDQMLYTIGYEGKSIEAFINILIKNDIRLLCDVRKNALSRKFGFSKNNLNHITKNVGIEYLHIPDLGIESSKRSLLRTIEDYQFLFQEYAENLPKLDHQLKQLYSLISNNDRIAIMCYEKEAAMCHRHIIRDYIVSTYHIRSEDL